MDELDLAMDGDVEVNEPEATEGGTVISGPQRFDVLLAAPLWPGGSDDGGRKGRRVG